MQNMNDSHAPLPSQQSSETTSASGASASTSGERKFAQIPKESVKAHAESIGISEVSDDVSAMVAEDACYRLREVMQASCQFMRHAKRKRLTAEDFNRALRWSNVEPMYGHNSPDPMVFRPTKDAELYFYEDREINLTEFAMETILPRNPGETTVKAQWLVVEGRDKGAGSSPALSEELVQYYDQVTRAILGGNEQLIKTALADLRTNSRVSALLPYFVYLVGEVKSISHDLEALTRLLQTAQALIQNPHLYLGPYLKQLVASVMYCILEPLAASINPLNDHWALRDYAARLLAQICRSGCMSVEGLQKQLPLALQKVLVDPARPLCSHYGAVVGLTALGSKAVEEVLYPQLGTYWPFLQSWMEDRTISNAQAKADAHRVQGAILSAAELLLKTYQQSSSDPHAESSHESSPNQSPHHPDASDFTIGTFGHLLESSGTAGPNSGGHRRDKGPVPITQMYSDLYSFFGDSLAVRVGNGAPFVPAKEDESDQDVEPIIEAGSSAFPSVQVERADLPPMLTFAGNGQPIDLSSMPSTSEATHTTTGGRRTSKRRQSSKESPKSKRARRAPSMSDIFSLSRASQRRRDIVVNIRGGRQVGKKKTKPGALLGAELSRLCRRVPFVGKRKKVKTLPGKVLQPSMGMLL
ncbi:TAF6L [Branchiostoma lanceolatum]|uniref:TAF6-like RNA polymerase II p300/CBP-associated factor-associated factor 65 kDa subunit 6L n=1 Tax=Branchiostoma lanceolatum TaxID=7740 RepID=A0A8J9ZRZ1_BRALA|nr:TAF6L [Branchiostoma lanceolatum]